MSYRSYSGRMIETLESRQLLSATLDVRLADGGSQVQVNSVGQVIDMEVWAVVKGSDGNLTNEAFQSAIASFLSTNQGIGSALGTLKAKVLAPFNNSGSTIGVNADLDGDGDADIGSNDQSQGSKFFAVRGDLSNPAAGTAAGSSVEWKVAELTFTVTKLLKGTQTDIITRPYSGLVGAMWREDGLWYNGSTGTLRAGRSVALLGTGSRSGTITGRVYNDRNANGTQDGGESGVAKRVVFLDSNNNGRLDSGERSTKTNSSGVYLFRDLAAGTYKVRHILPKGVRNTAPAKGLLTVTLGSSEDLADVDFGTTKTAMITGTLFNDLNGNRVRNSGEGKLANWRVFIDSDGDGRWDANEISSLTSAKGNFVLNAVPPGKHTVRVVRESGWKLTAPKSGYYRLALVSGQVKTGLLFGAKLI